VEEQLTVLVREHRELHAAISTAAQAQRKLLAPGELRRGQLEIASEVFPVRLLSGDFFNVLDLGDATGLALGDIAGKGLEAGLWLTCFVGLTRIRTATGPDPAAVASAINRDLCQLQGEAPVAALLLARLEPRRGRLIYCNAGQPSALLFRRNSEVELLDAGGPILGAVPGAAFRNGSTSWAPGDSLVVCSDGVTECQNPVDEEFGAARLLAAARAANPSSATRMLFSILSAVQVFREDRPQQDDMTLAVVRHTG
jgi:sigma-B regulation protein RsbU (phosphoserine phosphatase)